MLGTRRPFERFLIWAQLDQIAGGEACSDAALPQHLHQEPGRITARTAPEFERPFRSLNSGFHANHVLDPAIDESIQVDQKIDNAPARTVRLFEKPAELGSD